METAMIQTTEFETTQTTDPREAKLSEIIERGKVSLHKTLEEIQHEFEIREDMAVRPTAIDFLVQGHKIQPVIRDEAYDLTDHSQGQMLTRAGIPTQFAPKLMDLEENELLSLLVMIPFVDLSPSTSVPVLLSSAFNLLLSKGFKKVYIITVFYNDGM